MSPEPKIEFLMADGSKMRGYSGADTPAEFVRVEVPMHDGSLAFEWVCRAIVAPPDAPKADIGTAPTQEGA